MGAGPPTTAAASNSFFVSKPKPSEELKAEIVKMVVEDLVSPTFISQKHNISVVSVRKMVTDAGHKLPSKYNTKGTSNRSCQKR